MAVGKNVDSRHGSNEILGVKQTPRTQCGKHRTLTIYMDGERRRRKWTGETIQRRQTTVVADLMSLFRKIENNVTYFELVSVCMGYRRMCIIYEKIYKSQVFFANTNLFHIMQAVIKYKK